MRQSFAAGCPLSSCKQLLHDMQVRCVGGAVSDESAGSSGGWGVRPGNFCKVPFGVDGCFIHVVMISSNSDLALAKRFICMYS